MVFVNVFRFLSTGAFFPSTSPHVLLAILKTGVLRKEVLVSWFIQAARTKDNRLDGL